MGLSVRDEFIDQVAAAGFAAVRLPVRWSAHASVAPPYAADPGEATVPAAAVDVRFVMVWEQVAARFRDRGPVAAARGAPGTAHRR